MDALAAQRLGRGGLSESEQAELKVRKGEKVRDAWERLVRWVETLKIIPDDGIEVRVTRHGTIVRVRDNDTFRHPFRVKVSGTTARVSPGTVNDLVPVITENGGKRRIDNRDKDGVRVKDRDWPALKLDAKKASKDGRIYISLKVKQSVSGGISGVKENKAGEQVSENVEIVQTDSARGPLDGYGYYPLAFLRASSDGDSIEEVFQIVHHNIRYEFQERRPSEDDLKKDPDAKAVGRHLFIPT